MRQKLTHGGARSNAGRKRGGIAIGKAITLRMSPDALKRLERLKKTLGLSWPKLVERLVEAYPVPCEHESWEKHGSWNRCNDCGHGWHEGEEKGGKP